MGEKKAPSSASEVLQALHEFLLGPAPDFGSMPIEKVRKQLESEGLDTKTGYQLVREELAETHGELELGAARERRTKLQQLTVKASEFATATREELLAHLRSLAGTQDLAVAFRKYEDASDDDLRAILEDFAQLKTAGLDSDQDGDC